MASLLADFGPVKLWQSDDKQTTIKTVVLESLQALGLEPTTLLSVVDDGRRTQVKLHYQGTAGF